MEQTLRAGVVGEVHVDEQQRALGLHEELLVATKDRLGGEGEATVIRPHPDGAAVTVGAVEVALKDADVVVGGRHVGDHGPAVLAGAEEGEFPGDVDREEGKTVFSMGEREEDELFNVEGVAGVARVGEEELAAEVEGGEGEEVEGETGQFHGEAGERVEETRGAGVWVEGELDEPGAGAGVRVRVRVRVEEEEGAVGEGEGVGEGD